MNSEPASKQTIGMLISEVDMAISALYETIKREFSDRDMMDTYTPKIYLRTTDLRIGIQFVLMDLGVSCKALFISNNPFEKRHHIKNLLASVVEGFKLLLGFGKTRNHTLWSLLKTEINKTGNNILISESDNITSRLDDFASRCIDQDLRNLTFHYDNNMMKVYDKTVSLDSEEAATCCVCDLWCILQDIVTFCNKIDEYAKITLPISKPVSSSSINLNNSTMHSVVKLFFRENSKLMNTISEIIPKATQQLEGMANHAKRVQRIGEYMESQTIVDVPPFPELDNLKVLANNELLIRFMAIDLVTVLNAYLHSTTDIESSLNLRRVVVIKTSTLVHLYGYNDEEHGISLWKSLLSFVPSNNQELKKESEDIENLLSKITTGVNDKALRKTLVHLYDNNKKKGNVEAVIMTIEALNPITQIGQIMLMMHLYKMIQSFTSHLMNVLADNDHKAILESQKEVEELIYDTLAKLDSCQIDSDIKDAILNKVNKIKSMLS